MDITIAALLSLGSALGVGIYSNLSANKIKGEFNDIMDNIGIANKSGESFKINNVKKQNYGYDAFLKLPQALSFNQFDDIVNKIEDSMPCLIEYNKVKLNNNVPIRIITVPFNDLRFKPVDCKPYEILLGYNCSGEPILINMNKFPNVLISGAVGTGKSRTIFSIISNMIANFDDEVELYLTQIKKMDLFKFKYCPQVKYYAEDLNHCYDMYNRLLFETAIRGRKIESAGVENIYEYNKKAKEKMPYIIVVAEEFAFFMKDETDPDEVYDLKSKVLNDLKALILTGRALGLFIITCVQRPDATDLPPIIKANINTKVSYRQTTVINSQIAIDCPDAVSLPEREAIIITNEKKYMKSYYIDNSIISSYIKKQEYSPNAKFINYDPAAVIPIGKMDKAHKPDKGNKGKINSKGGKA